MADSNAVKSNAHLLHRINDKIYAPVVWLLRIAIGVVFVFAGFVKAVDPWGFYYKICDYLNVWGVDWLWSDSILACAVTVAATELTCGVLLLTGCLRRAIVWIMLAIMAVMLPLTAYIMLYNPVNDCGCFGDALVISNTATFWKNVAITAGLLYLLRYNNRVPGLFYFIIQWIVIVVSVFYCLVLSFLGYTYQPLAEFRPYPVGAELVEDDAADMRLVYERDGERRQFAVDSLPDSTWTYVDRVMTEGEKAGTSSFAIYDGDDEVTAEVLSTDGPQLLLLVSDPGQHRKARASMANNLNTYIRKHGGTMTGVVATSPDSLDLWIEQARPNFDVYTADDTSIKELVRGKAALVYLVDGRIVWKRNMYSLPGDFPDFRSTDNVLSQVYDVQNGTPLRQLTLLYVTVLGFLLLFSVFRLRPGHRQPAKTEKNNGAESEKILKNS